MTGGLRVSRRKYCTWSQGISLKLVVVLATSLYCQLRFGGTGSLAHAAAAHRHSHTAIRRSRMVALHLIRALSVGHLYPAGAHGAHLYAVGSNLGCGQQRLGIGWICLRPRAGGEQSSHEDKRHPSRAQQRRRAAHEGKRGEGHARGRWVD